MATTTPTQTLDLLGDTLDRLMTFLHDAKTAARAGEVNLALGTLGAFDAQVADVQAIIRVIVLERERGRQGGR